MVIFYSKKILFIKILVAIIVGAGLIFGILKFKDNQEFFTNFRAYYAIAYVEAARTFSSMQNVLARLSGGSFGDAGKNASSIPVLIYHGVIANGPGASSEGEGYDVTLENFADQMRSLKNAGYQTITLTDLNKFLAGEESLPEKSILITFDDGRKDSYYPVNPILKALGWNAAIFIIAKESLRDESTYYLNKNELKKIARNSSWEIGAHTNNGHVSLPLNETGSVTGHFYSNKLWLWDKFRVETEEEFRNRVTEDFKETKDLLQEITGREILSFAFPFGDAGQYSKNFPESTKILKESLGDFFSVYFSQYIPGVRFSQNYYESNKNIPISMTRISVKEDWTGKDLLDYLERGAYKELPYEDDMGSNRGWVSAWHSPQFKSGGMELLAGGQTVGSGVILDGTKAWEDYNLEADIERRGKNSVYVWLRFQDDNNFAACNFGDGFAHIEIKLKGEFRVIRGTRDNIKYPDGGNFEVGAIADGRTITCLLNGKVITQTDFLPPELNYGGIGFKTWDPDPADSRLIIKNLRVTDTSSI